MHSISNTYGTVPQKLLDLTLQVYQIPGKVQHLRQDYFNCLNMRFTCRDFTTIWQRLEKGIVAGSYSLLVSFTAAMNLLVKRVKKPRRGVVLAGVQQAPVKAFMNNLTITARSVPEDWWILETLGKIIAGARMEFKPSKSRSPVLIKGHIQDRICLKIGEELIPIVSKRPIKSLRNYRAQLNG